MEWREGGREGRGGGGEGGREGGEGGRGGEGGKGNFWQHVHVDTTLTITGSEYTIQEVDAGSSLEYTPKCNTSELLHYFTHVPTAFVYLQHTCTFRVLPQ